MSAAYSGTHPPQESPGTAVGKRPITSWRNGDILRSAQNLPPVVTVNPICFAGRDRHAAPSK